VQNAERDKCGHYMVDRNGCSPAEEVKKNTQGQYTLARVSSEERPTYSSAPMDCLRHRWK